MDEPKTNRTSIRQTLKPRLVAEPLASKLLLESDAGSIYHVIIELNLTFPGGRKAAYDVVRDEVSAIAAPRTNASMVRNLDGATHPYLFASLTKVEIDQLVATDAVRAAIFRIWESTELHAFTTVSVRTIKSDACHSAFSASGRDIVWAVLDSGIDGKHPHFVKNANLTLPAPLVAESFIVGSDPLEDACGHGTHVAGIIAGEGNDGAAAAFQTATDERSDFGFRVGAVRGIKGMAPECKLLSMRIMDDNGVGDATALINALERINQYNSYGRDIVVHGVNISAGYVPDPRWYAIGQTPVCVQVNLLVRSGVNVVVAAGNTGFTETKAFSEDNRLQLVARSTSYAAEFGTINDPGNAHLAITVGSTHREKPHTYGVSFFSSRGPTADGRLKPDLIAPGERIVSCATGANVANVLDADPSIVAGSFSYVEDSGTSMSAPHVSGVIAGFLSVRREYIGEAETVRDMVIAAASDLKRDARAQGAGIVDALRLFTNS